MINYELRITNIHGIIGIDKNDAVLSVRQPSAELQIRTKPTQLNATTKQAQVVIDQSRCFSEAGLKSYLELTDEFAQRGRQAALEAIAQNVVEGNRKANINIKADAVGEIAADKVFRAPDEFNITLMPTSRPKIDFVGGISFDPRPGEVNINFTPNSVEFSATAPTISFYWKQQPYFSFEFIGKNLDVNV